MKKSALGVFNGNSRNREYLQGLQAESKNPDLCQCGAVKSLPMYLVGKTDLCYDCYLATQEQDADSLREVLQNGDAMVFNQSGVEQADEAERKISAGTQRLIDAGCLDKNGNLIPYKSTGRRETPLAAEDVTDYYGEDGYEF